MLTRLEMKLQAPAPLSRNMASAFHGVLMEQIPSSYAEELHHSRLHPYAQHLEYRQGDWYWIVTCTGREASDILIRDTLLHTDSFLLKKAGIPVQIVSRTCEERSLQNLSESFCFGQSDRYAALCFLTPTAFKTAGRYLILPDLRCLYQSLMNKYDAACGTEQMADPETLEELTLQSEIVRYDLKSTIFPLEGSKVPGFYGTMTLRINGSQTMVNFANMLLAFGEYSGIGIKASLGMGAMQVIRERSSDR